MWTCGHVTPVMSTNSQKCLAIFLDTKLDFKKNLTITFTKANKNLSIS